MTHQPEDRLDADADTESDTDQQGKPDPDRIATRLDFGRELTLAKVRAGLTIRDLSRSVNVPGSTLGGYFSGAHLPALEPPDLLRTLLQSCGIIDADALDRWQAAYWRVKRPYLSRQRPPAAAEPGPRVWPLPPEDSPAAVPSAHPVVTRRPPAAVSTVAPVGRLVNAPSLRGRDDLLASLFDAVAGAGRPRRPAGEPGVHLLHGLGGCGKSSVALALARDAMSAGIQTWWLSADHGENVDAGMRALAIGLGAPVDHVRSGSLPDLVWRLLEGLESRWLLVLDNADDPRDALALPSGGVVDGTGWLRAVRSEHGSVVVTSRDGGATGGWGDPPPPWLRRHLVPTLAPGDGAEVLRELAGDLAGSPAEAQRLSSELGGLPLALKLAGRHIARAREIPAAMAKSGQVNDFVKYETALRKGQTALLQASPAARDAALERQEHASVTRTWELSLDLLHTQGLTSARPLLYTLAGLGAAPVPYALLFGTDAPGVSPLLRDMNVHQLWESLRALAGMSLVDLSSDEESGIETLTLHPLVRTISRRQAEFAAAAQDYLELTASMLTAVVESSNPKHPADWTIWRLLADHCTAPLDLINEYRIGRSPFHRIAIELAGRAASYLRAAGSFERAESICRRAIAAAGRILAADDPLVFSLQHDLARTHYDHGHFNEAEQDFRRVLTARRQNLGPDHPDTLATQHYLARTLRDRRKFAEARELFGQTLKARHRILGENHPDTLTSRNGVADLLRDLGRPHEARAIYQEVLARRTEVLGARHPATLVTRHYLALTEYALDELDAAEAEFRALIEVNREVRGPEHPRTLAVCQSLADVLHDLARLDESEQTARSLLRVRLRLLGEAHPATLVTRHRLGLILVDRGAVAAAEQEIRIVVEHRRRVLGPRHPETVAAQQGLKAIQHRRAAAESGGP